MSPHPARLGADRRAASDVPRYTDTHGLPRAVHEALTLGLGQLVEQDDFP
ncbi:hypothetical protein [Streptomyces melanosporofaciens]|nr:hypothetical protein [Streptomyces melanosporofaciens]